VDDLVEHVVDMRARDLREALAPPSADDLADEQALGPAPAARLGFQMALDEQLDDALDAIDADLTLGPRRGPGRLFRGRRVFPPGDVAQGLLRPPAGVREVERGKGAERQFLRHAVE